MQALGELLGREAASGRQAVVGRIVDVIGFSTVPVDELVAVDEDGGFHGELLGDAGRSALTAATPEVRRSNGLQVVSVEIHGSKVKELGLACGGRADVLLQPAARIPAEVWDRLSHRSPIALVTIVDGPAKDASALAVDRDGSVYGTLGPAVGQAERQQLVEAATTALQAARAGRQRLDTASGTALIEALVPSPRLVVVGSGDLVHALEAQAALLGWETRATDDRGEVEALLDWAGGSAALIVLSHDPHLDTPALEAGLSRPIPYVGAMGSRNTQSRRLDRMTARGIGPDQLDRIHRPIGLNLGGRRACEVALAIVAEILAVHCGRNAKPLRDTSGPIHG